MASKPNTNTLVLAIFAKGSNKVDPRPDSFSNKRNIVLGVVFPNKNKAKLRGQGVLTDFDIRFHISPFLGGI